MTTTKTFNLIILVNILSLTCLSTHSLSSTATTTKTPTPTAWPQQFHSLQVIKYNNTYQVVDLWYDWPKGRNLNIIQHQLGKLLYDLEWNNGTSFYYTLPVLDGDGGSKECNVVHFDVGILVPNWLDGAEYLGQEQVDGFLCNVWQKVDFLWYYEDVVSKRPVKWKFYTGRETHVMTFEVGAVLEDEKWQAPVYCFDKSNGEGYSRDGFGAAAASRENVLDGSLKGYALAM